MSNRQSWPSAVVDVAIVAAVVGLSFVPTVSPLAWSVLTQIALVRFGVSMAKQALGGTQGGGSGPSSGSGDPPPDRDDRRRSNRAREDRDARRVLLEPAFLAALVCAAAIVSACR